MTCHRHECHGKHDFQHTVVSKRLQEWDGFCISVVRRTGLQRQEFTYTAERHSLFLNLEGVARSGESFLDGNRVAFVARPEGSLAYVPPGRTWSGWDEGDASATYLQVSVDAAFAENLIGDSLEHGRIRPNFSFQDRGIESAARKIAAELAHVDSSSELIVQGQLTTIFGHLLRRSGEPRKQANGGLSPTVLRKLLGRMEDSLDLKISVPQLAQELGYSTAYLSRAFKLSTGMSPHAYFTKLRLDRAAHLLRTSSLSVTEIALQCGFSSGSHLSTSFRQTLAITPVAYRALWSK